MRLKISFSPDMRGARWQLLLWYLFGGGVIFAVVRWMMISRFVSYSFLTTWQYVFLCVFVIGGVIGTFRRMPARVWWETLFTLSVFLGVWYLCLLVMPQPVALVAASLLTLAYLFFPVLPIQNLFYLLGAVGIAVDLSGWLSAEFLIAGLVLCTLYDIVAAPPDGPIHLLHLVLEPHGLVPGIVVKRAMDPSSVTLLLGTMDLVLPFSLVGRAAFSGVWQAFVVLGGLLFAGVFLTRIQTTHSRAILPALTAGVVVPFVILHFLSLV